MPYDDAWLRVLASCNRAVKILRARGYDEPYIDEGNMPANWQELSRKHDELWDAVYRRPKVMRDRNEYTITDSGKTVFHIGDVITEGALFDENERVIRLGEMPAIGKGK